ncbi:MAG TPA: alpha/beta hydrolase [Candidatus Binatia bacterium]|nr:alpha/beta hydrolase [Candidatus Binatia bacterium]
MSSERQATSVPQYPEVPRHDVPLGGRSGFTLIAGRQVHYLEWGPAGAPAVLCLHGGGQTAYMFEEIGHALRERYHVLAPDLPDHGDSDPVVEFGRHGIAATLPALCAHFGLRRFAMIGASLGGIVSITYATAHPDSVSGIVLIDVGHKLEEDGVKKIMQFMSAHESFASLEEAAAEIAPYLPHRKNVRPERLSRNLRQRADGRWVWKHGYNRRLRADGAQSGRNWRNVIDGLDADCAGLRCPVLVLRGASSDVLSSQGAEEVAALIPNARLATVHNAGHLAAGDNPESTLNLVSAFLADISW